MGALRLKHKDWLTLGLKALAEAGPDKLTVEELCLRAGRSKGSFYHHFKTIEAYHLELAQAWSEHHTEAVIRLADTAATPAARLDVLNVATSVLDQRIGQGMRALASRNSAIADICRAVDLRRTQYLAQLHAATGTPLEAALVLARIEYAAFIGLHQTEPDLKPDEIQSLYRRFLALLGQART